MPDMPYLELLHSSNRCRGRRSGRPGDPGTRRDRAWRSGCPLGRRTRRARPVTWGPAARPRPWWSRPRDAPPPFGQGLDDPETAPAERGQGARTPPRLGHRAAVADLQFEQVAAAQPADPDLAGRQRAGVPEGVADQLADDDAGVVDDGLVDPRVGQLRAEALTGDRDAGRRVWQQYDARCPHLPVVPLTRTRPVVALPIRPKCPVGPVRKPGRLGSPPAQRVTGHPVTVITPDRTFVTNGNHPWIYPANGGLTPHAHVSSVTPRRHRTFPHQASLPSAETAESPGHAGLTGPPGTECPYGK